MNEEKLNEEILTEEQTSDAIRTLHIMLAVISGIRCILAIIQLVLLLREKDED